MIKQTQLRLITIITATFILSALSGVVFASNDADLQQQIATLSTPAPDPYPLSTYLPTTVVPPIPNPNPSNKAHYIAYTNSSTDIYIEYLQAQTIPLLSDNVYSQHITAEPNCTVTERATLLTLTGGDFLAIWSKDGCYARFVQNGLGEFELVDTAAWLDTTDWEIERIVNGDINQDGVDDLIIFWHIPSVGELRDAYYMVALAQPSGRFDLTMPPYLFAEDVRAIYPNVMDVNDDGYLDLLYEPIPTGGRFTTEIHAVYGMDDEIKFESTGTLLATLPYGASTLFGSIGDFNNDTRPDIWLGSDDDNGDEGQAWLLLNDGDLSFTVQQSFDTHENEFGVYNGSAHHPGINGCDVNLDGNLDVLTREKLQTGLTTVSHKVRLGDGSGGLSQNGIVLAEEVGSIFSAAVCGHIPPLLVDTSGNCKIGCIIPLTVELVQNDTFTSTMLLWKIVALFTLCGVTILLIPRKR